MTIRMLNETCKFKRNFNAIKDNVRKSNFNEDLNNWVRVANKYHGLGTLTDQQYNRLIKIIENRRWKIVGWKWEYK